MNKFKEIEKHWDSLPSDIERWQWIRDNQDTGVVVMLDNDDTYATIEDEDSYKEEADSVLLQFNHYIGCADGAGYLLESMGIAYSEV